MTEKISKFLEQSNAIEGVYDADSLAQAEVAWEFLISQTEMSVGVICQLHKILMLNHNLMPHEKGYLRKIPVYIGNREAMDYELIEERLKLLVQGMTLVPENSKSHHIQYEKIHPFVDGNGRTGRMLMNWERLRAGESILIIWEEEKHEYYKWFA